MVLCLNKNHVQFISCALSSKVILVSLKNAFVLRIYCLQANKQNLFTERGYRKTNNVSSVFKEKVLPVLKIYIRNLILLSRYLFDVNIIVLNKNTHIT